jgi:hypothetical protein
MARSDLLSLEGLLRGAKDITLLSFNPFLLSNLEKAGWLLLAAGFALSFLNTRAILPFSLLALLFVREREAPVYISYIQMIGLMLFLVVNMAWMFAGFYIYGGIQ